MNVIPDKLPEMKINEIIREFPQTVGLFKSYGIDSCCGGALQLKIVAERHGISLEKIIGEIEKL